MGMPLHEAIEQTQHLRAGGAGKEQESGEASAPVPTEQQLVRQNETSMQELQKLMGGL